MIYREIDWFLLHDIEEYYDYDAYSYSSALKIHGLSGLNAVNSFSPVSYTKVLEWDMS